MKSDTQGGTMGVIVMKMCRCYCSLCQGPALVSLVIYFYCGNKYTYLYACLYNIKFAILTILSIQFYNIKLHSQYYVTITNIYFQNFFIFPN